MNGGEHYAFRVFTAAQAAQKMNGGEHYAFRVFTAAQAAQKIVNNIVLFM
ncbi:hypothetical protein PTD2_15307 [Pseudoalteromonas tunicata D2]|uniref:Uncharacterized protein n=1 Tax=Pseudoalteromonas tunicata D2 TaxID=87626 RepID=A4CCX6_9GAMM|nr:hypothetical protein PTD2_15307 [Pseudoalteromonas tunicata D2]